MRHVAPLPAETVPLTAHLLGRFLAEDVTAPDDAPPHDKAMMDGFAVRSADLASGQTTFEIVEEIKAGQVPCRALQERQASRIMTGAPLPQGADAVIMVERSRLLDAGHVFLDDSGAKPGQHILAKGGEMRNGATVLSVGSVIQPQEIAILAAVGRSKVAVVSTPTVAILSTGDEVIDPPDIPAPGQIRNSNGPMLMAQATRAGSVPRYLGVARDQPDSLRRYIEDGLKANVFLLSGGVSAGVFDLVPGLLRAAGVEEHLHKVAMKPGKPVFFGTFARPGAAATLVFGLPGNPVSSFVCFELFVRPALTAHARPSRNDGPNHICRVDRRFSLSHRSTDLSSRRTLRRRPRLASTPGTLGRLIGFTRPYACQCVDRDHGRRRPPSCRPALCRCAP